MKKFNLLKEIIITDKQALLQALNSQKRFGIKLDGSITYTPDSEIVIFKTDSQPKHNPLSPKRVLSLDELFGDKYKTIENEGKIGIKATGAWREIVELNYDLALYDDTTPDGVAEFSDKDLEDIGWHADEFEISYRELIDVMEKECEGVLLCIEQEEPSYQFSGLGFVTNPKECYETLFEYVQNKVKTILKNDPLYSEDKLTEDEKEALEYFKIAL